ncbi:MAG: L-histidine N(alpha)-methyltransferase [Pseudomonadota bacterium]
MTQFNQTGLTGIAADVREGLSRSHKTLPPKLFYDERGSTLFEEITRLPEYYPTRTEAAILTVNADEICSRIGRDVSVSELGAGTATKTRILLDSLVRLQNKVDYFPLDVSHAALQMAQNELNAEYETVNVQPYVGDFEDLSFLDAHAPPRLVLYIGSSIGNLEQKDAIRLLKNVASHLSPGDHLLLGVDLVKNREVLLAAYNDCAGVTAAFNKNLLSRINRELNGHFDIDAFQHIAIWNESAARVEMHLESTCAQEIRIDALNQTLNFSEGERIHTENSYKYTIARLEDLMRSSGFDVEHIWTDPQSWFAVALGVIE